MDRHAFFKARDDDVELSLRASIMSVAIQCKRSGARAIHKTKFFRKQTQCSFFRKQVKRSALADVSLENKR
ncbi:hypothetical protein [Helicobacter canis]|uniref:hypothetical protein n=1 Tax=Helicobacter canis TaxID=29419 RepID=UPI0011C0789F|nr:hypothetical protein [Helicobacter canis]